MDARHNGRQGASHLRYEEFVAAALDTQRTLTAQTLTNIFCAHLTLDPVPPLNIVATPSPHVLRWCGTHAIDDVLVTRNEGYLEGFTSLIELDCECVLSAVYLSIMHSLHREYPELVAK